MNPTFYVFCEGTTEANYINLLRKHYRLPSVRVDAQIRKLNINEAYIKNFKQGKNSQPGDRDFLFYDLDHPKMLERLKAIPNVTLLVSNPCLEVWFLYHFKEHRSEITSKNCEKELIKLNGTYQKPQINDSLLKSLLENISIASKRSKASNVYKNPSSTVHLFIDILEDLSRMS